MTQFAPADAIILAGGLGTRLRSAVSQLPKPMAPVHGRPFLEYIIDYWIDQGIKRFVLSVGYLGGYIVEHFGNSYRGVKICYVHEKTSLGTGGGIRQALLQTEWLQSHAVILNGDTWYEVNSNQLVANATASNLPITVALKPMSHIDRYGGVSIDSNSKITGFGVNSPGQILINGGCYLIDIKEVSSCLINYPNKFSFEQDFLEPYAREGKIAASIQDATFLDIGIPSDYINASLLFRNKLSI